VKRIDLVRHLTACGCVLVREGGKHSVYANPAAGRQSTVPRHREIKAGLVRKICRDLDIAEP
jgi:predicted RNA binding protein YcfA (HicA-like mRNA interferase family)